MRRRLALVIALVLGSSAVHGQQISRQDSTPAAESTLASLFDVGASEWMVTAGPGFGISLFHSEPGHIYLVPSISWGRVLSRPVGPAALRGRFEWAIEV